MVVLFNPGKKDFKMKVTKKQLKEMVRKAISNRLNEADKDSSESVPKDIAPYAKKVDKFIMDTIAEARQLHDEGDDMMRENPLSSYDVQERNRFLLYRVGFLNNLIANLIMRFEDSHRQ